MRWRTVAKHHDTQQRGRDEVFQDYHLRVGEIVADTAPPAAVTLVEQRLDETEIGPAKFVTLIEVQPQPGVTAAALPDWLRLDREARDSGRLRRFRQHLQQGEAGTAGVVAGSARG